jgi:hypothetical protein
MIIYRGTKIYVSKFLKSDGTNDITTERVTLTAEYGRLV